MGKHSETELNQLIDKRIEDCTDYPLLCNIAKSKAGRQRIKTRVKQIMFNDGIADIDTCFALIESQTAFVK